MNCSIFSRNSGLVGCEIFSLNLVNMTDLTGGEGGHGVLISGQGEGAVDNPPVSLQGNVPAVAALVELLYGGDELVT